MKAPQGGSLLSQFLRSRRLELSLTQREVAEQLGYKPQFVTNWERGTSSPPAHVLPKIAQILKTPPQAILKILAEDSAAFWQEIFLPAKSSRQKKKA